MKTKIEVYLEKEAPFFKTYIKMLLFWHQIKNYNLKNTKFKLTIELDIKPKIKLLLIRDLFFFYNFFEVKKVETTY